MNTLDTHYYKEIDGLIYKYKIKEKKNEQGKKNKMLG